ncbi:hypothetical protein JD292_03935 [Leucobacter sp. CSA2]|uniref:Lipoprotein n=1 Tax=Leucobacter edaphi TaxID=2796472 RepID=A0A934UXS0_9MICO|nr:hypothetical protein [Leucobacter edaphi]MBK0421232.1 hypothetical protein [Leucobacter edaphi]
MKIRVLAGGLVCVAAALSLSACGGSGVDAKDPAAVSKAIETQLSAKGGDRVFSVSLGQDGDGMIGYRKGDAPPSWVSLSGGEATSEAADFMTGVPVDKVPVAGLVKMAQRAGEKCAGEGNAEAVLFGENGSLINGSCPKDSGPPMLQSLNGKDIGLTKDLTDASSLEQYIAGARESMGNESTGIMMSIHSTDPLLSISGPIVKSGTEDCQLDMGFGYPNGVTYSTTCTSPNPNEITKVQLDKLSGQKVADALVAGAKQMNLASPKEIKYVSIYSKDGHTYAEMSAANVVAMAQVEIV